jgi:hypothetical protein
VYGTVSDPGSHDAGSSSQLVNSRGSTARAISIACSRDGPERECRAVAALYEVRVAETRYVGSRVDGDDEAPVTSVARSDVGSADTPPGPHIPEAGKRSGNSGQLTTSGDAGNVLAEEDRRAGRFDGAFVFGPEVTGIGCS